jgi:CheY-like chemotaxis protein
VSSGDPSLREAQPLVRSSGTREDAGQDAEGGAKTSAASSPPTEPPAQPRRGQLLIVDDEVVFSGSLRRLFSNEHDVSVANRGRDAVDLLRSGRRFDAILCDLLMPEVTGIEVYSELRQIAPDQAECMIFLTGGAFSESSQQFLDGISNRWFEKPCNLDQLRAAVREVVVRNGRR